MKAMAVIGSMVMRRLLPANAGQLAHTRCLQQLERQS
jgi:hypothetical protein